MEQSPQTSQKNSPQYDFRDDCEFYCVSYNSPERAKTMTDRFTALGIHLNIHGGVQMDDPRLAHTDDMWLRRLWSCCYGHIDNLENFLKTGKKYGFTCEDDVHIRKDLADMMPTIIRDFEEMKLDILLLGYMTTVPIYDWYSGYHFAKTYEPERPYQYHRYPNHQWGIHLAMISRDYARRVVDEFAYDYAPKTVKDNTIAPFNPDWTITKLTNERALMYPMMAVEDGKGNYDHWGQGEYHRQSHAANYNPETFL